MYEIFSSMEEKEILVSALKKNCTLKEMIFFVYSSDAPPILENAIRCVTEKLLCYNDTIRIYHSKKSTAGLYDEYSHNNCKKSMIGVYCDGFPLGKVYNWLLRNGPLYQC